MKVAVIGIGSNSVRMLVAEVDGATGVRLAREREGTRLFAGLDEKTRCLHGEAMAKTVAAVAKMAAQARGMGAEEISLFATSATRDAGNADELAQRLRDEAGLELNVCSGEDEAALSFLGATDGQRCGVIDIGGGSTELVIGQGDPPSRSCAKSWRNRPTRSCPSAGSARAAPSPPWARCCGGPPGPTAPTCTAPGCLSPGFRRRPASWRT